MRFSEHDVRKLAGEIYARKVARRTFECISEQDVLQIARDSIWAAQVFAEAVTESRIPKRPPPTSTPDTEDREPRRTAMGD